MLQITDNDKVCPVPKKVDEYHNNILLQLVMGLALGAPIWGKAYERSKLFQY
jgi:hypothetical protein